MVAGFQNTICIWLQILKKSKQIHVYGLGHALKHGYSCKITIVAISHNCHDFPLQVSQIFWKTFCPNQYKFCMNLDVSSDSNNPLINFHKCRNFPLHFRDIKLAQWYDVTAWLMPNVSQAALFSAEFCIWNEILLFALIGYITISWRFMLSFPFDVFWLKCRTMVLRIWMDLGLKKGQRVLRSVLWFDNDEYEEGIKHFLLLWDRKSGFDCFFETAFLGIMNVFDAAEWYVTVIEKKGQKGRCGKSCNIIRGVFLALFMLGYSQARGP